MHSRLRNQMDVVVAKSNPGKVAIDLSRSTFIKRCEDASHSQRTACEIQEGLLVSRSFGVRTRPRVAFPHCVHCININSPFRNDEEAGGLRDYFHRLAWRVSEVAQRKTPLCEEHVRLCAKMVHFSGWLIVVQYNGFVVDAQIVVNSVGVLDQFNMTQ